MSSSSPDKLKLDVSPGRERRARKPFLLRIDPALWDDLERWAQDELRSVNGQIEMILRQAVGKRKGSADKTAR